jgi:hypothetical protein
VSAHDAQGGSGSLSYSVVWGDDNGIQNPFLSPTLNSNHQSATFTHNYSQAGTYAPKFTVTNNSGQIAQTSLSVNVQNVVVQTETPTISSIVPAGCPTNWGLTGSTNFTTGESCSSARVGTTVFVNGSNFNSNSRLFIDNGSFSPVDGNRIVVNTNFISSSSISFIVPANIGAGTHSIQINNNSVLSNAVNLAVTVPFVSQCSLTAQVTDSHLSSNNTAWGFYIRVDGNNLNPGSSGWIADFQGYTPEVTRYGVPKLYGEFFVSAGPLTFTARDQIDSNCTTTITVSPPAVPISTTPFRPGCSSDAGFSSVDGQACGTPTFPSTGSCTISSTLRMGSKGSDVSCLQNSLGISADGDFGPKTKAAVMAFQSKSGLTADGAVGPLTIKALGK